MSAHWTAEQRTALDEMITDGHSYSVIAERLNVTQGALKGQCHRWEISHRSSSSLLTGTDVARLFGVTKHRLYRWVKGGLIKARGPGLHRRFRYRDVVTFVHKVDTWMAWEANDITDESLRREALAARARGPRWLTTHEIATRCSTTHGNVAAWIRDGELVATKWGDWFVRDDHVAAFVPPCERPRQ